MVPLKALFDHFRIRYPCLKTDHFQLWLHYEADFHIYTAVKQKGILFKIEKRPYRSQN